MAECFAASIGGCGGGATLEHFVSAAVLKNVHATPLVKGWPGIDEVKRVGVGALGSKILCQEHNTDLSPMDAEAHHFFEAVHAFDGALADQSHAVTTEEVEIDGSLLERWLLKLGLGLAAVHTKAGERQVLRRHDQLMRVLFGLDPWPATWGLYVPNNPSDQYIAPADVAVMTWHEPQGSEIWQVAVWARFLPVVMVLGKPDQGLCYRPSQLILDRAGEDAVKRINLRWAESGSDDTLRFTRVGSIEGWADLPE